MKLENDYLSQLLDEDLYSSYRTGRRFKNLGVGLLISGVLITGFGSYGLIWSVTSSEAQAKDIKDATSVLGLGIPLIVAGSIFTVVGKKKVASVADKYNLTFGSTNSGVGLTMTF